MTNNAFTFASNGPAASPKIRIDAALASMRLCRKDHLQLKRLSSTHAAFQEWYR